METSIHHPGMWAAALAVGHRAQYHARSQAPGPVAEALLREHCHQARAGRGGLRLVAMLASGSFDFEHDLGAIFEAMSWGCMGLVGTRLVRNGCFIPRFAGKPEPWEVVILGSFATLERANLETIEDLHGSLKEAKEWGARAWERVMQSETREVKLRNELAHAKTEAKAAKLRAGYRPRGPFIKGRGSS